MKKQEAIFLCKQREKINEAAWSLVLTAGCMVFECSCHITHFGSDDGELYWDEGELEDLRKRQELFPHKYKERDGHVSCGHILDMPLAYGCNGCEKKLIRITDFLLSNKRSIRTFYSTVQELIEKEANDLRDVANQMKDEE